MPNLLIAKNSTVELSVASSMANRHGLITGATGTGKTVTLQVLAENFSRIGVPVFMADVKGDLTGLAQAGSLTPKIQERLKSLGLSNPAFRACPVTFWDLFGEKGHPIRATVSDMGPLLMARLLNLNETQTAVLHLVFKVADDNGMLLLDFKDLRAMVQFAGENAKELNNQYGNISPTTIGAIQRSLLVIEQQGAGSFFGEPALDLYDLIKTDSSGQGVVNILSAEKLIQSPGAYTSFLLWLLSELFEHLPEAGDLDKPKLVFFFDEAHLLFEDAPKSLLDKIEQVVRLVRSKGVGIYFVTQNPADVSNNVLSQLGNRVQHALRAFTPIEQKKLKVAAQTFRKNPKLDTEAVISTLSVGEALISFLDESGQPQIVERAWILPPQSQIGPISESDRQNKIRSSSFYGRYENGVDRESAFEKISARTNRHLDNIRVPADTSSPSPAPRSVGRAPKAQNMGQDILLQTTRSVARSVGTQIGRQIVRGILGSIFSGR